VQPFKARLGDTPLSSYVLYWQVDGGTLNLMGDSQTDAPHKEALVDLSNWTWNGAGSYLLNFIAKNLSGGTLGSQSTSIFVTH
jgi:hypothetical protein